MTPEDLPSSVAFQPASALDRRAHPRIPVQELQWIAEARLKYGPAVALVDLSDGGVLMQSTTPLKPGSAMVLEIITADVVAVPFRVLRSHITALGQNGPLYLGACEFKRPIALADVRSGKSAPPLRLDLAMKSLLHEGPAHLVDAGRTAARGASLPQLLRALQANAPSDDPLTRAARQLLADVVPALERGEPVAAVRARLEQRLRALMPDLKITVAAVPTPPVPGYETVYFAAGELTGSGHVINVAVPIGRAMTDWQFRLLQAAGHLVGLVSSGRMAAAPTVFARPKELAASAQLRAGTGPAEPRAAAPAVVTRETPNIGWQKIVVRYPDGRLLKGYSHDFHPTRKHLSLWPSLDALPHERVHIPLAQLKAVFFVRDFNGNPARLDDPTFDDASGSGRRMEVVFTDGEVLLGRTLSYRPDAIGFFVSPADRQANNLRVFVIAGAIRHFRFL